MTFVCHDGDAEIKKQSNPVSANLNLISKVELK